MSRVSLTVSMELLSDAIFGSGFSIPGGEDIAVCEDDAGYPYLKGTTWKGLLRESLENWLDWTGASREALREIMGEEGWEGTTDGRRLHLTSLTLKEKPASSEDCFATRTFTSLENGVVRTDTLRTAVCVCRGLTFTGELVCGEEDVDLLKNALACVKYAGTLRNRGFGRVRVACGPGRAAEKSASLPPTRCIHYRLRTELPVLITDPGRSHGNSYETRGYIPGSAIRGMVVSTLAARDPDRFRENRAALLSDDTRFLDAVPCREGRAVLPSIMGFYENKEETVFQTVVRDGTFQEGLKRAKLGSFCALKDGTVEYWSAGTDGVTRIQRNVSGEEDARPFQTRYLSAGQEFEGYILLEDGALAPEIAEAFPETVWLGADRYEGFGQCTVSLLEAADSPAWSAAYGCGKETDAGAIWYLLAWSPLTMLNDLGEPCGIDTAALAEKLGVGRVEIPFCSTSMSAYGAYNRTWQCQAPSVRMYDRGSVFKLVCDRSPAMAAIQAVQREGLGIRRAEGCGQVMFLSAALFEGLRRKEKLERENGDPAEARSARLRRKRYQWIMDHEDQVMTNGLSKSQLGDIQAQCERAMALGGDTRELDAFFEKNLHDRGARHGNRFEKIERLVRDVLNDPLPGVLDTGSTGERLALLCLLFDYCRKGKKKEGM